MARCATRWITTLVFILFFLFMFVYLNAHLSSNNFNGLPLPLHKSITTTGRLQQVYRQALAREERNRAKLQSRHEALVKQLAEINITTAQQVLETSNKRQNMSLLLVTAGVFGCTRMGGIASAFTRLAYVLRDAGFKTHILYTDPHCVERSLQEQIQVYEEQKINLIPLPTDTPKLYGTKMMQRSFYVYEFLKAHSSEYPLVVFHDYMSIAYFTLLAKHQGLAFLSTTFILSCHSNTRLSDKFNHRVPADVDDLVVYFQERESYRFADMVTSPSVWYFTWLKTERYPIPQAALPLQNNLYPFFSPHFRITTSPSINVAYFARLEILKGLFVFLDALDEVFSTPKLHKPKKVIFVGVPGSIGSKTGWDYAQARCNSWGIPCILRDNLSSQEAIAYLKELQALVVLPTLGETSSYTVMECLYNGIPFITSKVGGVSELIHKNSQHVLFPKGDVVLISQLVHLGLTEGIPPAFPAVPFAVTAARWVQMFEYLYERPVHLEQLAEVEQPLVSLIISHTAKHETYLLELLFGLSKQTYPNFEVIVVVKGELASSVYIQQFQLRTNQSHVRFVPFESDMEDGARNRGASAAKGDYLCFLADSDLPRPYMLSSYVQVALRTGAQILGDFSDHHYLNNGQFHFDHTALALGNALSVGMMRNYFSQNNMFIHKASFDAIGGNDEAKVPSSLVDWDFYLKASLHGLRFELIPEPLFIHRVLPSNPYSSTVDHDFQRVISSTWQHLTRNEPESVRHGLWDLFLHLSGPRAHKQKRRRKK
eukprot:m.185048 g.185048  ORF g.185048 m.185048 type:complete len:768 (-) comp25553_c0_seq22:123-2426(-)